jgi:hypothetical protein
LYGGEFRFLRITPHVEGKEPEIVSTAADRFVITAASGTAPPLSWFLATVLLLTVRAGVSVMLLGKVRPEASAVFVPEEFSKEDAARFPDIKVEKRAASRRLLYVGFIERLHTPREFSGGGTWHLGKKERGRESFSRLFRGCLVRPASGPQRRLQSKPLGRQPLPRFFSEWGAAYCRPSHRLQF